MKNNGNYYWTILFLLFFISQGANSQVDSKYLKGAVPEVNGKVIFSDTLLLPGMSKNSIYEKVLKWAQANYNTEDSRITFTNEEKGNIACKGYDKLVFASGALSLDQSFMNYQLVFYCTDNICRYDLKSISYEYNVADKKTPEKYPAEEWITDKEAVNKTKLYRNNGKFRIKTIDLVDDIYNSLSITFNTGEVDLYAVKEKGNRYSRPSESHQKGVAATPIQSTVSQQAVITTTPPVHKQIIPEAPLAITSSGTASTVMSGYKRLDAEKIPGNIIKMLSNDWMLVTAGNDSKFNMMTATWGGLGFLYEKPVAFCFINPARYTYQLMESGDTYTISFYTEAYRDILRYCGTSSGKDTDKVKGSGLTPITLPSGCKSFSEAWLIIECKKLVSQTISAESIKDKQTREEFGKTPLHTMYVGEILNVWVK